MSDNQIIDRLERLDSCTISDALDTLKIPGVVLGLRQLTSTKKLCGRALTMTLSRIEEAPCPGTSHLGTKAIELGDEQSVIIVAHGQRLNVSGWGGILSQAAFKKGIRGVIIDGAARDIDESIKLEFPIYGRTAVPITARGRITEVAVNQSVTIDKLEIDPADYVLADGSGVVFIKANNVENVLEIAEKIALKEKAILKDILEGQPISEVMDKKYENMLDSERQ